MGNCVTLYSQSLGIIESTLVEAAEAQMNDMSEGDDAILKFCIILLYLRNESI